MPRLLYAFALEQQSPLTRLHPMTWVAIAVSFSICALVTLDPLLLTLLGMLLLGFILLGRLPLGNTLGVLTVVLPLRFLPLVLDELETINNAQKSRGYDIDRTNVIVKPFRVFPLMVPLVLTALRRAGLIALAMDLRGFHATPERSFYFDVHRGSA